MNRHELSLEIRRKKSCLCIGLDSDIQKIPAVLRNESDPVFAFNKAIVDATHGFAVSYKPNLAFYESVGPRGMETLEKTVDYIRSVDPALFIIADAKRGDIGNTADQYARSFFVHYGFDAVTLSPYMGQDSVLPFLAYDDKWVILLALTSNTGAQDFELLRTSENRFIFEEVISSSMKWGGPDKLMFVVGATQGEYLTRIRQLAPDNFFLIPGVGAQGGQLDLVLSETLNEQGGVLVNSSRGIIFASTGKDFDQQAAQAAQAIQLEMSKFL